MIRSRRASILLSASLALASPWAYADPPQAASDPCRAHHPGDPCEADDFEGVCKRRRCTRETDDGVRSFHCLVCESRRHHSSHRDAGARRHHRGDALDASAEAEPDATTDDASDASEEAVDVAGDAPVRRDVSVRAPAAPTARRGLFSCATSPGRASGVCAVWAALAVGLLRRRFRRGAAASAP